MSLELLGLVIRLVVLSGAIVFAFVLLFYGFYIVLREYRLVDNFDKMERYLKLSSEVGLQADAAKGSLGLSRATPGIMLTLIGAFILTVCIFQKYEYESNSEKMGKDAGQSKPAPLPSLQFEESVSKALRDLDSRVTVIEKNMSKQPAFFLYEEGLTPWRIMPTSFKPTAAFLTSKALRDNLSFIVTQENAPDAILRKWLSSAHEIEGVKKVEGKIELLIKKYGDVDVMFERVMLEEAKTVDAIAEQEYGHARYAPLLRAFNPSLPKDATPVPRYTVIPIYYPREASGLKTERQRIKMRITGMSREQVYDRVLEIVTGILASREYKASPVKWWQDRFPNLGAGEFTRVLQAETGRPWGARIIHSEDGEDLQTLAKVHYGKRQYFPILQFLNYQLSKESQNPKTPLPEKTPIVIVQLNEF